MSGTLPLLLPIPILEMPRLGCLNLHASLLPIAPETAVDWFPLFAGLLPPIGQRPTQDDL